MQVMTRKDAWKAGHKKYWTGKACERGHDSARYVASGACVRCLKERNAGFSTARKLTRADSMFGFELVELKIHRDDKAMIVDFAAGLAVARRRTIEQEQRAALARAMVGTGFTTVDGTGNTR